MARVSNGALAEVLRGKIGEVVIAETKHGLVVRPRTMPSNPRTAAQTGVRGNLARAVAAYRALTPAEAAQWQAYAATQVRADVRMGTANRPSAYPVFVGLASKYLQVEPEGVIPTTPPPFPFAGDPITLTTAGVQGAVQFTASTANSAGTRTELLLQPLRFGHQAPKTRAYRTQAFAAFTPGSLTVALPAAPGWYAPAYRFVNAATGQEAGLLALEAVEVG